jgi:hypothetical protein
VGWIREDGEKKGGDRDLYLEPDAAFAVVQKLGRDMNEPLSLGSRTYSSGLKKKATCSRSTGPGRRPGPVGRGGDVTTAEIIARARRAGIVLGVKDGSLHLGGSQSSMAPDLLEEIRQRREEVIAWLTGMAGEVSARWNAYNEGFLPSLPRKE